MKMIKAGIIENVKEEAEIIHNLLDGYSQTHDVIISTSLFESGFDLLENDPTSFDVVFMDIDMPVMNGMETSEKLRALSKNVSIIFVTNLPQYAISGYKVGALDFILKPVTKADFTLAMDRFLEKTSQNSGSLTLRNKNSIRRIPADDIEYIGMSGHDVVIHLADNKEDIIFRGSIKAVEKDIDSDFLQKCNSGYIVNIKRITSIEDDLVIMESGARLEISRSHKKEFMSLMCNMIMGHKIK